MKPIASTLDILQAEKDVTSGNLLPPIVVIRNALLRLKSREDGSPDCPQISISTPLVDALLDGLKTRFDPFFKEEYFQLAAALNPKFKLHWPFENEQEKKLKSNIIRKIELLLEREHSHTSVATTPEDPKDFYSGLNQRDVAFRLKDNIGLTRFIEAKVTNNLSVLNNFPKLKPLF